MFSSSSCVCSRSSWRLFNSKSFRRFHSTQPYCQPSIVPPSASSTPSPLLLYSNQKYERQILTSANCDQFNGFSDRARGLVDFLKVQDYQIAAQLEKTRHIDHPALKLIRNYVQIYNHQPQTNRLIVSLLADTLNAVYPQLVDDQLKDAQRSVGEIVELLHLCQLIHRNLLDLHLPSYRRMEADELKQLEHGNKIAILFGDFLFTVAISMMAALYNIEISTLISQSINGQSSGLYVFETSGEYVLRTITLDNWKSLNYEMCGLNLENGCRALVELLLARRHSPVIQDSDQLKSLVAQFGQSFFFAWQTMIEMNQFYELAALPSPTNRFDLLSAPIVLDANRLPELVKKVKLSYGTNQCKPTVDFDLLRSHFDLDHLRLPNTRNQIHHFADQALVCLHTLCPHRSSPLENIIAILKRQ